MAPASLIGAGPTGGWRRHPGTSAGAHFTAMPTRGLRTRGARALGDNFRMAEVGAIGWP
jgi:hypothetical protein